MTDLPPLDAADHAAIARVVEYARSHVGPEGAEPVAAQTCELSNRWRCALLYSPRPGALCRHLVIYLPPLHRIPSEAAVRALAALFGFSESPRRTLLWVDQSQEQSAEVHAVECFTFP